LGADLGEREYAGDIDKYRNGGRGKVTEKGRWVGKVKCI